MRIAVAGGTGTVGAHVVAALETAGHEPVVLTRRTGVDVRTGAGLAAALAGVDAVVDATSTGAMRAAEAIDFFGGVTRTLLDAEAAAGVPHHVALSIVGIEKVPYPHYLGKRRQEELVTASGAGWSILRATQFHEFTGLLLAAGRVGPLQIVPLMRSQPVAAEVVGRALAELATGAPAGRVADLAGPREEAMPELVRRVARADGIRRPVLAVPFPGAAGRGFRDGSLLPGPGARLEGPTFAEWLASR